MFSDPPRLDGKGSRIPRFWRAWRWHIIGFWLLLMILLMMYLPNAGQRIYIGQTGIDRRTLISVACKVREMCAKLQAAVPTCRPESAGVACASQDLPRISLGLCDHNGEMAALPQHAQPDALQCFGSRLMDWAIPAQGEATQAR